MGAVKPSPTPVRVTPKREKYKYYSVRMTEGMIERLKEQTELKTKEIGYPVSVSALCRHYIQTGLDRDV